MPNQTLTAKNSIVESSTKPFEFSVGFAGHMDMYADTKTVAKYLNAHEGWFCRCAQPMKVTPLGNNGYVLNIGRFASLGYEVEPKIAVVLDPPQDNLYVMRTIPVPGYDTPGYEVQYKGLMELEEISAAEIVKASAKKLFGKKQTIPATITRVSWQLDLTVTVEFPKFINKVPANIVQNTGDRLLAQIVRQISPRLTYKVQQDFHQAQKLPLPPKSGRGLNKLIKKSDLAVSSCYEETQSSICNTQNSDEDKCAA